MKIKIYLLFVFFGMIGSSRVHAQSEYAANEKQRQELMKEYGLTADQAQSIQVFSRERTDRIEALKARNLSEQRYREEREIITDEYYRKVAGILSPEQRAKFDPEAFKAARSGEIARLKLSKTKAIQMGALKADYEAKRKELTDRDLPARDQKSQSEILEKNYRADVKRLIGDEKFAEWIAFKNTELERKYKNKYRFTDEQFEQYKRIENKKAVDIYTIKKSAISAAEKKTKIQAVKEWKIEQMQKILSAEQFEKWHSDYLRAEQNRRKAK